MKSRLFAGKLLVVGAVTLFGLTALMPVKAGALVAHGTDPVQISPICSTAEASTATWSAYNKNAFDVTFDWTNKDTDVSGSYTAPANTTTDFQTNYRAGVNNQTEFTNEGSTSPVDRNATNTECTPVVPPVATCIDGAVASNLVTTWNNAGVFTVHTKDNALLCGDVTIYASSYVLPANYDGTGFGGPTSYPQNIYDSVQAVLAQGTDGTATLTVALPDSCVSNQQDLYYAPEITVVGANGHGSQFINGGIIPKTTDNCETGGMGGGPTTPTEPTAPAEPTEPTQPPVGGKGAGPVIAATTPIIATTVTPAGRLTDTGVNSTAISIIAALLLAAATSIATRRSKITS